jgi:ubiquinone/menaquinone biosynthesis C-methylase UbiE
VSHPIFARIYGRVVKSADARGAGEHRDKLLARLTGRVVELGAGNGGNFPHYPETVTELIAVEPEPRLRADAERAIAEAPVPVRVIDGLADELPLEDASCDAAVVSLVLCSVPDQTRSLTELSRVIRPGGELRFYEHVLSERPLPARLQRLADATVWPRVAGGCHLSRDTGSAIERAGFEISTMERFPFRPAAAAPSTPHILGSARRP